MMKNALVFSVLFLMLFGLVQITAAQDVPATKTYVVLQARPLLSLPLIDRPLINWPIFNRPVFARPLFTQQLMVVQTEEVVTQPVVIERAYRFAPRYRYRMVW